MPGHIPSISAANRNFSNIVIIVNAQTIFPRFSVSILSRIITLIYGFQKYIMTKIVVGTTNECVVQTINNTNNL